jgi:CubicO group peptidase (beta-lactamase class C family)
VYRQTCNGQPGAPKRAALLISFGACAWIEAGGGPNMCAGRVERGFEVVEAAFAEVVRTQPGTGAAVAVWLDGRWLVDLWGGPADTATGRAWGRDSIVQPYSVTKPFVAVCALLLVERGELELDAVVQRYWPEFTARATVRQLLAHQAGVVALDAPAPTELFYDWQAMCSRLAAQPPAWEPGTAHGESALFYGHLVGELVRRIDGRSVGGFLRDEVCAPLGLDFAIGLGPTDQARAVDITGLDEAFREPGAGEPELYRRAIANPPGARDSAVVNSARWRAAEIPAVNGHGTGRGVAGFYAALLEGRVLADKRRLRPPYVSPASGTAPASLVDVSRDVSPFHSTPAATVASRSFSGGLKAPRLAARRAPASGQRVRTSSDGPAAGDRDSLSGARRAAARPARIEVAAGGNQRQSATPRSAGASPPTRPLPRACVPASERRRVWKRDRIYAPYAPSDPLVSTTR